MRRIEWISLKLKLGELECELLQNEGPICMGPRNEVTNNTESESTTTKPSRLEDE